MRKHLSPIGNSLGLVLDKPILELLRIGRETELEISTDGHRLIIEPVREKSERVREATERVLKKHAKTMAKLAK
jgi:antitoxin MazE